MAKTHVGFRFNDEILSKITVLQEIENEEAKKADRQPKDKTAIVTQAIEFYYVQKLSAGEADILIENITLGITDLLKQYLNAMMKSQNSVLYEAMFTREYQKLMAKRMKFPDGISPRDYIFDEDGYDEAIKEKVEWRIHQESKKE